MSKSLCALLAATGQWQCPLTCPSDKATKVRLVGCPLDLSGVALVFSPQANPCSNTLCPNNSLGYSASSLSTQKPDLWLRPVDSGWMMLTQGNRCAPSGSLTARRSHSVHSPAKYKSLLLLITVCFWEL